MRNCNSRARYAHYRPCPWGAPLLCRFIAHLIALQGIPKPSCSKRDPFVTDAQGCDELPCPSAMAESRRLRMPHQWHDLSSHVNRWGRRVTQAPRHLVPRCLPGQPSGSHLRATCSGDAFATQGSRESHKIKSSNIEGKAARMSSHSISSHSSVAVRSLAS